MNRRIPFRDGTSLDNKLTTTDSDNVYYSLSVYNDGQQLGKLVTATFSENRSSALLTDQENFKLIVMKFRLPVSSIFLFNDKMNNLGEVALSFARVPYNETVILTNSDNATTPPTPQTICNSGPLPFAVYSYQQYLEAINFALANAMIALLTANPGITPTPPTPYFIFNEVTQLFSLVADKSFDENDMSNYNGIKISCNNFIWKIIGQAMPGFYDYLIFTSYLRFQFLVFDTHNNTFNSDYHMTGQFSSCPYWFFIQKVVMQSSRLNVDPVNIGNVGGIPLIQNVLTEYDISFETTLQYSTPITYVNDTGYHRTDIDIVSTGPLNNIDVTMSFIDAFQDVYPVVIREYELFDALLKFEKYK